MISDKWPQATKHYIIKWETEITKKNPNGETVAYYWDGRKWDKDSVKYYTSLAQAVKDCERLGGCVMDTFD